MSSQRLSERYWQMLALAHPDGALVLVASSLGVVNKVFSTRSPLLGLVAPVRIGLISLGDAIASLIPRLGPLDSVLWGVLLQEPWLSAMPGVFSAKPWEWIADSANLLYSVAQSTLRETALALYARELQFSLAELLAEHHGGIPSYTILPHREGDVDTVVLDKAVKKPIAA